MSEFTFLLSLSFQPLLILSSYFLLFLQLLLKQDSWFDLSLNLTFKFTPCLYLFLQKFIFVLDLFLELLVKFTLQLHFSLQLLLNFSPLHLCFSQGRMSLFDRLPIELCKSLTLLFKMLNQSIDLIGTTLILYMFLLFNQSPILLLPLNYLFIGLLQLLQFYILPDNNLFIILKISLHLIDLYLVLFMLFLALCYILFQFITFFCHQLLLL